MIIKPYTSIYIVCMNSGQSPVLQSDDYRVWHDILKLVCDIKESLDILAVEPAFSPISRSETALSE